MRADAKQGGIALFGGTFDPLHIGHCIIAQQAWEQFNLSKVIFIPCFQSPHKPEIQTAPPEDRMSMLKAALSDLDWAEVSDYEISRSQPSFSVETAEWFAGRHPGTPLFWIMGTDQWNVLEKWKDSDRLAELVTFIVFPRPDLPSEKKGIRHLQLGTRVDISASMVRELIRKGLPFHFFVPTPVHSHIRNRGLYSYES
jgi:nicotinate-nucleotide adenylyltransferase